MARAETTVEAAVLPGMIHVKTGIVAARVVSNPPVAIDVRRFRMTGLIGKVAILRLCVMLLIVVLG